MNSLKLKHADSVLPPEYELKSSKFQLLPPQPHSREQQSKQQQDAHGTLPSSTSNKIPRGKSPSIESIAKEEIKLTNLLSSTEFDHLMEEFNTLMAQVEQKPPIRSTTPIHPAYSSSKSMTEYPLKSSFYDPFSVGRPESQSQDRVGLLPTLANQVPDQHSSGHPQEVQEFKSDEDEEMENMIHTSNRYINRNNLNYQSDDTNPPQPPSPSSTYYYSHHLRGRSKSEGENSDEESDWERNISHHSRKYDYPQSTSVLRDSLESNREVESLQQERNRRKEFEQQRTGIKSDFFHLNHERKENDQEISNHYQYHDQDPDYDQDDDQDHDQDQDRGLDEEYLYDSYQYQNSKQQQPIPSEFPRYSQFPNDRHGDDDDLEIDSQASYTKMDKMEKESGFMSTTEEKDKFTGRIGPEELQLINESLMASLQIEREAKEKIQAENRALEVES